MRFAKLAKFAKFGLSSPWPTFAAQADVCCPGRHLPPRPTETPPRPTETAPRPTETPPRPTETLERPNASELSQSRSRRLARGSSS